MEILEIKIIITEMKISLGSINSKSETAEESSSELESRSVLQTGEEWNKDWKKIKSHKSDKTN